MDRYKVNDNTTFVLSEDGGWVLFNDHRAEVEKLRELARTAGAKLQQLAAEFNSPRFTDRYADGPECEKIARAILAELAERKAGGE